MRLLRTLPPEMSFGGARPSQEQKGLALGHLLLSVFILARSGWAMESLRPLRVRLATRGSGSLRGHEGVGRRLEAWRDDRESPCKLGIARTQLGRGAIEEGEGLGQHQQMLWTPRAGPRPGALFCVSLTAGVA